MAKIALLLLLVAISNCAAVNNTCTSAGKFIADVNCTSYVVCSQIDNTLATYTIPCPPGFMVRHTDMVCSMTGTQCLPSYACTSVGNFTNPASTNVSSYISCIPGIGEIIIATAMECLAPLEFNATLGRCELKTVAQSAPTAAAGSVATVVAANELAESVTEVIPPTVATVVQTAGKMPNSSSFVVPSFNALFSSVSALLLFYNMK